MDAGADITAYNLQCSRREVKTLEASLVLAQTQVAQLMELNFRLGEQVLYFAMIAGLPPAPNALAGRRTLFPSLRQLTGDGIAR
jgi:hypothetical protein